MDEFMTKPVFKNQMQEQLIKANLIQWAERRLKTRLQKLATSTTNSFKGPNALGLHLKNKFKSSSLIIYFQIYYHKIISNSSF